VRSDGNSSSTLVAFSWPLLEKGDGVKLESMTRVNTGGVADADGDTDVAVGCSVLTDSALVWSQFHCCHQ